MPNADIALIGLAVMGQNLVLNMANNGYQVAVYNRTAAKTDDFINGPAADKSIEAAYEIEDLIGRLKSPRRVMIMVKAGPAVDAVIDQVKPYLGQGDIIIDGGNSLYGDTERRTKALAEEGIHFLGVGISGGEEGALRGPSIMPGGDRGAYSHVEPIYTDISAKVAESDGSLSPCVTYLGTGSAGHYVKMVHNGIEYGDMQLIAEAYDLLHRGLGLSAQELHEVFSTWNEGVLQSFLIEITAEIFATTDPETGQPMVDVILDKAKQKGTGKWTSQDALNLGGAIPTINAAVVGRIISSFKDERVAAAQQLSGPDSSYTGDKPAFIDAVHDALYASKICSYAQGMVLLRLADEEYGYGLDYGEVARIWRGGCIIRALFLNDITSAYRNNPALTNLLLDPFFKEAIATRQTAWRHVVKTGIDLGIPVPAMAASLAYFDSYRTARLPANLIQAQRDFFGAHTFERVDQEGVFHHEWQDLGNK
ncbi:MAG: NADP-dependent phosphogluconate dehydrogenase [Chloroflexi bacterium]|nr:NADP-dependent phosphogluconate dehydrogenase [Chloroflexota bacterium]